MSLLTFMVLLMVMAEASERRDDRGVTYRASARVFARQARLRVKTFLDLEAEADDQAPKFRHSRMGMTPQILMII